MSETPDPVLAIRAAIRHWSRLPQLAEFALLRHGFGETDGGFGITYPSDVDEYDREARHVFIPPAHVSVYGFWGLPEGYEVIVHETLYIETLATVLAEAGFVAEAVQVCILLKPAAPTA